MQLTEYVRKCLAGKKELGTGLKAMASDTGIPYSCLYEFLQGGSMRGDNLDKLVRYLDLWDDKKGTWAGR